MLKKLYHYELDTSPESLKKVNLTKIRSLENELKDIGFKIFVGSYLTSGIGKSLIVGLDDSSMASMENATEIINDLELPYKYVETYTERES